MSYRIVYGAAVPQKRTGGGRILRLQMMTAVFLLLFTLFVSLTWPAGTAKLREYLLPADGNTQTALQEFVSGLEEGESAREALTAFCRQMIADGQAD